VSAVSQAQQIPRLSHTGQVTQLRVALSEWTKLRSLRSTLWSLFAGVLLTILLPVLFAAITSSHWGSMSPHERADRHPLDIALAGVNVSQLAIAVLGVLVITGEYSTGMIRASFTAVPKRLPVLWAKTGVFAVVAFLLMLPSVLIAFFASQAILSRHHILQISFSHPGVARSVIGTLWRVDDGGTRELMVEFYQRLTKGSCKGTSLREAQLALIHGREFADPYYWAAFSLFGDWGDLSGGRASCTLTRR